MSAASDYLENALLDHTLGNVAYTQPANYVALFTAVTGLESNAPTAEVSGGSYARQTVSFGAASGGSASNDALVTFPEATADWGTVTHVAIMDAATTGNVLVWSALTTSRSILTGDTLEIRVGDLTVTLD